MTGILEKLAVILPVVVLLTLMAILGVPALERLSLDYLFSAPEAQGRAGGIGPILFNTLVIVGGALVLAIPIALASAGVGVLLEPKRGNRTNGFGSFALGLLDVGTSVPRLLWGLAGAALFGGVLGLGITAATGILTLACLLVPILATGFADGLRREMQRLGPTLDALGIAPTTGLFRVVVPASLLSIQTSVLLATGRAMGDAAALLLTAGISMHALSAIDQSASTLAVVIYFLAVDVGGGREAALSSAFVLLILTAMIQIPASLVSVRRQV